MEDRKLVDILFFAERDSQYGLHLIFRFAKGYLYFNPNRFSIANDNDIYQLFKWEKVSYEAIGSGLSIIKIREDEVTSYFVEFSNGDIFFIYLQFNGETWWQDFEIVSKNNVQRHREVTAYMNEDFVEDVVL